MPIKRTYLPPYADVMDAAQTVGLGAFQKDQRRENLAVAELAQRDLAQRRALAADQQRQQAAFAQHQMDQANRMAMAGWQAALQERNIIRGHEWDVENRQFDRDARVADIGAANAEWDRRDQIDFGQQWEMGGIDAAEKGMTADLAGLVKAREQMTPEGVNKLGKLMGKWREIQGARASMPPNEYARIVEEFAGEVQASGVHEHIKAPPTPEEQDAEIARRVRPGPGGNSYIIQPDGEIRPVPPPKPVENKTPATFEDRYADYETYSKDFDAEAKRILDERKATQTEDGPAPKPPTRDEVLKSMRERFSGWQSIRPKPAPTVEQAAAQMQAQGIGTSSNPNISLGAEGAGKLQQMAEQQQQIPVIKATGPKQYTDGTPIETHNNDGFRKQALALPPGTVFQDETGLRYVTINQGYALPGQSDGFVDEDRNNVTDFDGRPGQSSISGGGYGWSGELPPLMTERRPQVAESAADLTDQEIAAHLEFRGVPPQAAQLVTRDLIAKHEAAGSEDPIMAAATEAAYSGALPDQQQPQQPQPQVQGDVIEYKGKKIPVRDVPRISGDKEFAKLPSGPFIDPNGMLRVKP